MKTDNSCFQLETLFCLSLALLHLGVGADDVFVFYDAFKQSAHEVKAVHRLNTSEVDPELKALGCQPIESNIPFQSYGFRYVNLHPYNEPRAVSGSVLGRDDVRGLPLISLFFNMCL